MNPEFDFDSAAVTALIAERYGLPAALELRLENKSRDYVHLLLTIDRPGIRGRPAGRYTLEIAHERGADPDPLEATLDALDALFGMLVENDYAVRELPAGAGVTHGESTFTVRVSAGLPEIESAADAYLRLSGAQIPEG